MAEKDTISYYQRRMDALGVTAELNNINIWRNGTDGNVLEPMQIFQQVPEGIKILLYTLQRSLINFKTESSRWSKTYSITRLETPVIKNGKEAKYLLPKGAGTYPFFPPKLVEAYEQKTSIHTLFLVEGYFKAFKADMHGAYIIGLSSITHMRDAEKGALHTEILDLIKTCQVKRIVWLTDGDCLDLSRNAGIDADLDLYTRPSQFFTSISTFKTLLDDYDLEKWFIHVDIDAIRDSVSGNHTRDDFKGIDDLLCYFSNEQATQKQIITELHSVSAAGTFFKKFNITHGLGKVWRHFHLQDVKDFYLFHTERRPEIKDKEFVFRGTRYAYNAETGDCDVKVPSSAKLYFRVGDDYYKWVNIPNQYKQLEKYFKNRKTSTIKQDHGANIFKHIAKYEEFCNVPVHGPEYARIINNCFNVYNELEIQPDEEPCTDEDCPTILRFILHLFGNKTVTYRHPGTKERREHNTYEMALDYLQILFQQPWLKLPIICLVSKENNTGKSTFANFLRIMLSSNVAIVGNADLAGDFNAHWVTKKVVICDEAKIDKVHVIDKIKSLSTARKIYMNAKGKSQVELDCFLVFVLITNNEENFITLTDDDIRYWVIKVPQLTSENPRILDTFVEEMPAFLSFLNRRKLSTEESGRMWFHPDLLKTEARQRIIRYSMPTAEKEIRYYLENLFLNTGYDEIKMTPTVIHKQVFGNRYEKNYIAKILQDNLKVRPYHVYYLQGDPKTEFSTRDEATNAALQKFANGQDTGSFEVDRFIHVKEKQIRYSYPDYVEQMKDGKMERLRIEVSDNGRPLVFYRKDFVTERDGVTVDIGAEAEQLTQLLPEGTVPPPPADDLPF
jgi:hypothetical protein